MPSTLPLLLRRASELAVAVLFGGVVGMALARLGEGHLLAGLLAFVLAAKFYAFFFHSDLYLRCAARAFSLVFYRVRVTGRENVPPTGGAILVCNHVSFVDWILVAAFVGRPVRFVIDHVYYRGWLMKSILRLVRVIPIADPREDRDRVSRAYDRILQELAAGEVVCIFPEGKITHDGKLNPFKPGVIKVLKRAPVPVVPMALNGLWGSVFSRKDGPALRKLPRRLRGPVELRIGEPVPAAEATLALLEGRVRALCTSHDP